MNKVLLTGRLTRDPELRTTAGGKAVASFSVASHEFAAGKEKSEFHNIVAWDRLAETCGRYLGKGQQVAVEGRIQTRTWDDDQGKRHWKTEIVASSVEMLSGRRKKDYAAETAATALEAQAMAAGIEPGASEPVADESGFSVAPGGDDDEEEEDELLEEAVAA
jgi:single-strand DNA-binding protein